MNSKGQVLSGLSIQNFKSIRQADVELRPLTVLVGENSAGKSSLLQLLFLLSQSTRGRTRSDVMSLNGMELNLGNFNDVLHRHSSGQDIEIALKAPISGLLRRRLRRMRSMGVGIESSGEDLEEGEWRISLGEPKGQLGVATVVKIGIHDPRSGVRLCIEPNTDKDMSPRLYERSHALGLIWASGGRFTAVGADTTGFHGQLVSPQGDTKDKELGVFPVVIVDNGFPIEIYSYTDEAVALADRWLELSIDPSMGSVEAAQLRFQQRLRRRGLSSKPQRVDSAALADELFPAFYQWVRNFDRSEERASEEAIEPFDTKTREAVLGASDDITHAMAERLRLKRRERGAIAPNAPEAIQVADGIRSILHDSVHYLGPLREDPSLSYRPGQSGGVATLGVKGEFTVAALDMYRRQLISAPLPGGDVKSLPLGEAVNRWVAAFGLASEVRTEDKGRLGIELELVDSQTGGSRDLTSVGVGVSQLLPVIVISLLAKPGSLILLEQPELHLHPAPQQILGDFLLALADSGRQVIVETHSEYLINRLRLRIAEDEDGKVNETVQLLYATRRDGETRFDVMRPNPYGTFEEWPEGFFDQAPRESEAILRAAVRKRRSREGLNRPEDTSTSLIPIYVEYQSQRVEAMCDPTTGEVLIVTQPLEGLLYESPTRAATAVVRKLNPAARSNRNGWTFWRVSATGSPLSSIRP